MIVKIWTVFLALLVAISATASANDQEADAAPPSGEGSDCNNYGVILQAGIGNEYNCTSMVQYCHQGTGAGAGAGAGGPGTSEAGAEATAGTSCNQSNGGNGGDDECHGFSADSSQDLLAEQCPALDARVDDLEAGLAGESGDGDEASDDGGAIAGDAADPR